MSLLLVLLGALPISGLEVPSKVQTQKLEKSELAEGLKVATCLDFGKLRLVQIDDPGLMGASALWTQDASASACGSRPARARDLLTTLEGFTGGLQGKAGDLLFFFGADGFGDDLGLRVASLKSGGVLLTTTFDFSQPIQLVRSSVLRFHRALEVTCQPRGDKAKLCWASLRKKAGIEEAVALEPPPCDAAIKASDGVALIAVPVEVQLPSAKLRFLPGRATCSEAP